MFRQGNFKHRNTGLLLAGAILLSSCGTSASTPIPATTNTTAISITTIAASATYQPADTTTTAATTAATTAPTLTDTAVAPASSNTQSATNTIPVPPTGTTAPTPLSLAPTNTMPPVPTITVSTQAPALGDSDSTAALLAILKSANLPIGETTIYTADNDPNKLLGRPNQYTAKASWHDTRLPAPANPHEIEVSDGGGIEVWPDQQGAQARADYIQAIAKKLPLAVEYDYVFGKVLLRLAKDLTPTQASAYQAAFQAAGVK